MWRCWSTTAARLHLQHLRNGVCRSNTRLVPAVKQPQRLFSSYPSNGLLLMRVSMSAGRWELTRTLATNSLAHSDGIAPSRKKAAGSSRPRRDKQTEESWRNLKAAITKCVTNDQVEQMERSLMGRSGLFTLGWGGKVVPWQPTSLSKQDPKKRVLLYRLEDPSEATSSSREGSTSGGNPVVLVSKALVMANLLNRYVQCRNHIKVVELFNNLQRTPGFEISSSLQKKYLTSLGHLRRYDDVLQYFEHYCDDDSVIGSSNVCNVLLVAARVAKRGDIALEIFRRVRASMLPVDQSVYANALIVVLNHHPHSAQRISHALEIYEFMHSECGFLLNPYMWSMLGDRMLRASYPVDQLCKWLDTAEANAIPLFGARMTNLCTAPLCMKGKQEMALELVEHCASNYSTHDKHGCAKFLSNVMWSVLREGTTIALLEDYAKLMNKYNARAAASVLSKTFEVYLDPKKHPPGTSPMKIVYDLFVLWDRNPVAFTLSPFALFKALEQIFKNKWVDECEAVIKYATERNTVLYLDTLDRVFAFYAEMGEFYRIVRLAEQVMDGPKFTENMYECLLKAYFHMEEYRKVVELNENHQVTASFPQNTILRTIVEHAREHAGL